jgi:GntR family transcriptional regulator
VTGGLYAVPMAHPRYQQIADDLRGQMESGKFPPDSKLPSKTELMEHYGVAQGTIDHAMAILREAGLVEPVHGVAVFVRKPPELGPSEYDVVIARIAELDERVRRLEELRAEERGERA